MQKFLIIFTMLILLGVGGAAGVKVERYKAELRDAQAQQGLLRQENASLQEKIAVIQGLQTVYDELKAELNTVKLSLEVAVEKTEGISQEKKRLDNQLQNLDKINQDLRDTVKRMQHKNTVQAVDVRAVPDVSEVIQEMPANG